MKKKLPDFKNKPAEPQPAAVPLVKGQVFIRIVCPYCKSPKVKMLRSKGTIRYYECGNCDDGMGPTNFKVPTRTHEERTS